MCKGHRRGERKPVQLLWDQRVFGIVKSLVLLPTGNMYYNNESRKVLVVRYTERLLLWVPKYHMSSVTGLASFANNLARRSWWCGCTLHWPLPPTLAISRACRNRFPDQAKVACFQDDWLVACGVVGGLWGWWPVGGSQECPAQSGI